MTVTAVIGAQYGDEGKGRIIDYLAQEADMVIRFQGGDNAGHTVVNEHGKFALHIIPSGIFNPDTANIIGTGCVVNPQGVLEELGSLEEAGIDTGNLWISSRAQMLMPYHRDLDGLEERLRDEGQKIGTTLRGVGPAYVDKMSRAGLRLGDLLDDIWLEERVENAVARTNRYLSSMGAETVDIGGVFAFCADMRDGLRHRIVDTTPMVHEALERESTVLLEGQLGIMRDLDWGIYPYVTSSNPSAAFAAVGAGIPMQSISRVIGITKAYATAVGTGPFPTELENETGERLRDVGGEYGATTGRPRRCGWLDLVSLRYGAWLNGMTELAMTKLDVLDGFDRIQVCVGYRRADGSTETRYLPDTPEMNVVQPIYEELPGWLEPTTDCRKWEDLPENAQNLVNRVSQAVGLPISLIGVGPERSQIVVV